MTPHQRCRARAEALYRLARTPEGETITVTKDLREAAGPCADLFAARAGALERQERERGHG